MDDTNLLVGRKVKVEAFFSTQMYDNIINKNKN